MKYLVAFALVSTLATGCGSLAREYLLPTKQICFDRVESQKVWVRFKEFYDRVLKPQMIAAESVKGRVQNSREKELIALDKEYEQVKIEIDFMYSNPGIEVNYEKVMALIMKGIAVGLR